MKAQGKEPQTRIASREEYERLIRLKLREEVAEFIHDDKPEELADILEVLRAVAETKGITFDELEKMRVKKKEERGGFEKGIILES